MARTSAMGLSSSGSSVDMSAFATTGPVFERELSSRSTEQSPDEAFFEEDLVWPDPTNRFEKVSGIKPAILSAELKHLHGGYRPKDVCEQALEVRKRPRPREVPWNVVIIKSDPPDLDHIDDLEEFLVHDNMFVEFFNAFLSLPTFAEAVRFNVDTGGFEVVSDDKRKLAQQIKEAVRSQNTTANMYKVARQHAFSDIPIVPIEDEGASEKVKLKTTFPVIMLNKEQGMQWVKAQRVPVFVRSDCYYQYRLAKVISQARLFNEHGEYVVMKIDYMNRSKTKHRSVPKPPPSEEEIIVKEMYISFGDMKGAAKEAWFTHAKEQLRAETTSTTLSPRVSSSVKKRSKNAVFKSAYFGVYNPGLAGPSDTEPPLQDSAKVRKCMEDIERPFTPRPTDLIHASTSMLRTKLSDDPDAEEELVTPGNVVYVWPKSDGQLTDSESGFGEMDDREERFRKRMIAQAIIDQIYGDGSWEEGGAGNIILKSVEELSSVIVGAVMKRTLAAHLDIDEKLVAAHPTVNSIFPSSDLCCISVDKLDLCLVVSQGESEDGEPTALVSGTENTSLSVDEPLDILDKQPVHIKWTKEMPKSVEEESDAESMLDSEEDFEERDLHFRRNKEKWHSLSSMRGIMAFKKFLTGTPGEKFWYFWIDIDKGRNLPDTEHKAKYILMMREKYYKTGAPFELTGEDKKKLGLEKIPNWCPEYLLQVQSRVLEPLVLYWAPRYLLKHLIRTHPEKHHLYSQMKASMPARESDPYPHTQDLLPLGPKSCCPRNKSGPGSEEVGLNMNKPIDEDYAVTPRVGNRRFYGEDTLRRLAVTATGKYLKRKSNIKHGGPKLPPIKKPKSKTTFEVPKRKSTKISRLGDSIRSSRIRSSRIRSSLKPSTISSATDDTLRPSPMTKSFHGHVGEALDEKALAAALTKSKIPCPSKPLTVLKDAGDHPCGTSNVVLGPVTSVAPSPGTSTALGPVRSVALGHITKPSDSLPPMVSTADSKVEKLKRSESIPLRNLVSQELSSYTFYRQDTQDISDTADGSLVKAEAASGTRECQMADIKDTEFFGSERLKVLLQALHHEQDSGRVFRRYIVRTGKEHWKNNIDFWEKVQQYRKLFYKDKLDLHLIARQARSVFAEFIVEGAPQSIGVSESIEFSILNHLNPCREDLYDEAEEHALKVLFAVYQCFLSQDVKSYCKVDRFETKRRLETRSPHIYNLQRLGIMEEGRISPEDPAMGYREWPPDEFVWDRVPHPFKDWTLSKLSLNRLELEYFWQFLLENGADIDLRCWMDIEAWRRTQADQPELRDHRAKEIKRLYLNKKYFFGPHSPTDAEGQNRVMQVGGGWGKYLDDKPSGNTILEAQKYVKERIEKKHLPRFFQSLEFLERQAEKRVYAELKDTYLKFMKKRKASQVMNDILQDAESAFYRFLKKHGPEYGEYESFALPPVQKRYLDSGHPSSQSLKSGGSVTRSTRIASEGTGHEPTEGAFSSGILSSESQGFNTTEATQPMSNVETSSDGQSLLMAPFSKEWSELCMGESKWMGAVKEVFMFSKALHNPVTLTRFRKFVACLDQRLKNDVMFWAEASKYKIMHKNNYGKEMLEQQIRSIIHCFLASPIPPSLQVDIPQEIVDRIIEEQDALQLDVFNDAQTSIFRELLPCWVPFREFIHNTGASVKVLKTLERHRLIAQQKEKEYYEEIARQRERERLIREGLLPESDEYVELEEKVSLALKKKVVENATQTIRGIPEFPEQHAEERPGYEDDSRVDEAAKHYRKEDYRVYRKYLNQESEESQEPGTSQRFGKKKKKEKGSVSSKRSKVNLETDSSQDAESDLKGKKSKLEPGSDQSKRPSTFSSSRKSSRKEE